MVDFLNEKLWTSFMKEDLDSIKDFVLIWNVFEDKCFQKSFNVSKIEWFLQNKNFNFNLFLEYLLYFQKRYVEGKSFTEKYQLHFRSGDNEELVKDVLLWKISDQKIIISWMIIIIYRYRNNLFHWLKEFWRLDSQRENFIIANNLLKTILYQVL